MDAQSASYCKANTSAGFAPQSNRMPAEPSDLEQTAVRWPSELGAPGLQASAAAFTGAISATDAYRSSRASSKDFISIADIFSGLYIPSSSDILSGTEASGCNLMPLQHERGRMSNPNVAQVSFDRVRKFPINRGAVSSGGEARWNPPHVELEKVFPTFDQRVACMSLGHSRHAIDASRSTLLGHSRSSSTSAVDSGAINPKRTPGGCLRCAVRMRGLPFSATVQDIRKFFGKDAQHIESDWDIQLQYNSDQRPTGFAVVHFNSLDAAEMAYKRHHMQEMGSRYIELLLLGENLFPSNQPPPPRETSNNVSRRSSLTKHSKCNPVATAAQLLPSNTTRTSATESPVTGCPETSARSVGQPTAESCKGAGLQNVVEMTAEGKTGTEASIPGSDARRSPDPELHRDSEGSASRLDDEEIIQEIEEIVRSTNGTSIKLSMLGTQLSRKTTERLRANRMKLKTFLRQHPTIFLLEGSMGFERIQLDPQWVANRPLITSAHSDTVLTIFEDSLSQVHGARMLESDGILYQRPRFTGLAVSMADHCPMPAPASSPPGIDSNDSTEGFARIHHIDWRAPCSTTVDSNTGDALSHSKLRQTAGCPLSHPRTLITREDNSAASQGSIGTMVNSEANSEATGATTGSAPTHARCSGGSQKGEELLRVQTTSISELELLSSFLAYFNKSQAGRAALDELRSSLPAGPSSDWLEDRRTSHAASNYISDGKPNESPGLGTIRPPPGLPERRSVQVSSYEEKGGFAASDSVLRHPRNAVSCGLSALKETHAYGSDRAGLLKHAAPTGEMTSSKRRWTLPDDVLYTDNEPNHAAESLQMTQEEVCLRGLPYVASIDDIRAFLGSFANKLAKRHGIRILKNRAGQPSGQAVVRFQSSNAAAQVQQYLHRKPMGRRYIEVLRNVTDPTQSINWRRPQARECFNSAVDQNRTHSRDQLLLFHTSGNSPLASPAGTPPSSPVSVTDIRISPSFSHPWGKSDAEVYTSLASRRWFSGDLSYDDLLVEIKQVFGLANTASTASTAISGSVDFKDTSLPTSPRDLELVCKHTVDGSMELAHPSACKSKPKLPLTDVENRISSMARATLQNKDLSIKRFMKQFPQYFEISRCAFTGQELATMV